MKAYYGNENVTGTLTSMLSSGRVAHAFLLFGENGLGKKTLAGQFATQIVRSGGDLHREIHPLSHPDILWVEHSGAKQGFSVETLRDLCADAFVMPNNGDKKVYILADCDSISVAAQNTLLKIIEEPPAFTHFIFTAQSKSVFLPTILSRVISLGVLECSEEDCRTALQDHGITDEAQIKEAITAFGGNVGLCLQYLKGPELRQVVEITRQLTDSLCAGSEYKLLKTLTLLENSRTRAKTVLTMLDKIVRDSCVLRLANVKMTGCYAEGSKKLGEVLSSRKAGRLHELLTDSMQAIDGNVNVSLELSALCGRMSNL